MKRSAIALTFLIATSPSFAGSTPDKELVERYLSASKTKETVDAQLEGSLQQYAAGSSPEAKAKMAQYFESTMGWGAIKDQYVALIQKSYTSEELKAALTFIKSPLGASMIKKNPGFSREVAAFMAGNAQRSARQGTDAAFADVEAPPRAPGELATSDVEEHSIDGKVYFTGTIENRGKRAARGVQIELNLFSGDKFVDQYTSYISGTLAPGAVRYFKVSCGCKDSPPAPHDAFKINVVDGY